MATPGTQYMMQAGLAAGMSATQDFHPPHPNPMDPHLSEPVDMLPAGQMSTSQSRIALPCVNDKVVQIPYMSMLEPTIDVLKSISGERRVSVPAVAMNYSINKGVVPLLGVRVAEQTEQDMQALGWRLTEDEMKRIEAVSVKGQTSSSLQHG